MTAREVVLEGGAPWGFRMHGGVDQNQPLRISRVNPGSKAAHRGIREGDLISSISGQSTKHLTNAEAHGFLKNSGEILKLGLNEDPGGSPKRRQYRTVHQETLQETVKRSSITTYSVSKTVERVDSQSDKDNENSIENNGHSSINGTSKIPPSDLLVTKKPSSSSSSSPTLTKEDLRTNSSENAFASQRSSYTNCTLSPSSPSILSEDGTCSCNLGQDDEDQQNITLDNMNDNQNSSRSKRRRQRRKHQNRKITESRDINDCDNIETTSNKETENDLAEEYTVQSPVELSKNKNISKKTTKPVKSRSLDDDEMLNIQEVSEVSESEDKEKESQAIVSEASESEVEWEEATDLNTSLPIHGSLSTLTLPLEGCISEQINSMSPQEEKTLRDFLDGLNLVNGPEEAVNQVCDKNSPENIKQRKARKRAELEQYFLPIYQNPRYLDVISEESRESSDRDSDREQPKTSLSRILRKGTPEVDESANNPPKVPQRLNRDRKKILPKFASSVDQAPAVLVDTKIIDTPEKSEAICSSFITGEEATVSNVEIVYLTSSETDSADELGSNSSSSYVLASDNSSNEDLSEKTLVNIKTDEIVSNTKPNESEKTISSTQYSFSVKSSKNITDHNENIVNIDLLNQLTPPPTPDDTKETINEPETHINVLTPPPPSRSSSSSRSSSRGSSLCTAKYNPSTSSITDVIALMKEDFEEGKYFQAPTLREICLNFLLSLPFGKDVLEELADVSKCIESYTRSLPSTVLPRLVPKLAHSNSNNVYYNLSVQLPPKKRQEEISYVKRIPKIETENFRLPEENSPPENVKNDTTDEYINIMERRIPIKVDSDYKPKQNVVIPFSVDKEVEKMNEQKSNDNHEVTIPIIIEKDIKENVNNQEIGKKREVRIPVKIEAEPKVVVIPIQKEIVIDSQKDEKVTKRNDTTKTQQKEKNVVPKEFVIPIIEEKSINNEIIKEIKSTNEKIIPIVKEWIGMPTEKDPKVLVCLSPKQKDQLEKSKQLTDEASKLIDLHEKFINRKSYHEEVKKETEVTNQQHCNRLLTIIREEPTAANDDKDYLYFVGKEPSPTLPRVMDSARLNAKDLTEWLNLARNKSMSESNLTTVPDIPENNLRHNFTKQVPPTRRTSLPHDLFEKQMFYIQEKEREIQRQLEAVEEEKRMLHTKQFHADDYHFSRKGDFAVSKKRPISMPMMPTEYFRQQMYEEYMDKFAEREERKQHKIIKVTSSKDLTQEDAKTEIIHPIQIEDEFMHKVKELQKVGKLETVKSMEKEMGNDKNKEEDEPPVLVIDGEELKEAKELPKHLQEFVAPDGIWSPGQKFDLSPKELEQRGYDSQQDESLPPIWTPKSANSSPVAERKEFRPVNFQSPVLGRRNRTSSENSGGQNPIQTSSWKPADYNSDTGSASSVFGSASSVLERRLPISRSTPATGFSEFTSTSRLPKAQNPTITLLQKAREGQLPKGALYIDQEPRQFRPKNDRPPIAGPGEVLYQIKNEYTSESDTERPRKMTDLGPRKFEGIGPVTKDGIPLVLRSEIKDQNQTKWYKRMYDTIHKQKPHNDEYVTIRYKQKRAQYPYTSGYLSEPEPGAYDSDFTDYKYQTLDRRRPLPQDRSSDYINSTMPRPTVNRSSSSDIVRNTQDYYKTPGKIENYTPGHSSIAEKEAKQWWDEVMDIFDGHLEQQNRVQTQSHPKSFINQCLKESGYESDSTLVFRRREEAAANQISPREQREAYKVIQKGGDVPLHGLRKLAPEKPKEPEPPVPPPKGQYARNQEQESPRKYVENEVTIHYKTPVRQEIKDYLSEDELAHRQAEVMKKIYQEERRKKYLQVSKSLQELQDMNSRRHTDNFIPSQKSPISLNRYDDFDDLAPNVRPRPRSPEHRLCARALYNFVGQSARELTFRKGDIIYLRRQIDKNWYEGELNAMVGLFPANYVEIIPFEGSKTKSTLRKAHEGQARAKYNFVAQTHLELSLAKGELVVVTKKIDENWYEGKIGGRKGIFPSNYVEMLIDPQTSTTPSSKPVASPAAHSLLLNGSSGGKESMGSHSYTPSLPIAPQLTSSYHAKPVHVLNSGGTYGKHPGINQTLHIETQSEPIPYRAMYKYKPQNEDELELMEGDTVYVLEKCDDGWYVGSSDRTGAFGTFPGNYVEKI